MPRDMTPADLAECGRLPLFSGLSPTRRAELLRGAEMRHYAPGDVLFEQGVQPEHLHVVIEGLVSLIGLASDGREVPIELLEPGEYFILAAVLREARCLMGARAVKQSRVLLIPAEGFRRALLNDASLAVAVAAAVAEDFRTMVREVKALKLKPPVERLAVYILSLTDVEAGAAKVVLPVPAGIVAQRLGMTAETFSRCLRRLESVGVSGRGRRLAIEDVGRLASVCTTIDVPDH